MADSLTHTRWGRTLFKNLGFCLFQGSLTVVLGKNRAAKDALLAMLAGKAQPRRGQVRFEGEPVFGHSEYQRLVMHIGTENDLTPGLSVKENIEHFVPAAFETARLVTASLRYFRLEAYVDTPCGALPPLVQRRVQYARLLAAPCPIWLMRHDAELLDAEGNALLYTLISNRCNQDGIVVMAAESADFITPNLPVDLEDFA